MQNSLRISPIGLNETDQRVLDVAVRLLQDEGFACTLSDDRQDRSQIVVLDAEDQRGHQLLSAPSRHQVRLVLGQRHINGKNLVSLIKPVRVATLKGILEKICSRIFTQLQQVDCTGDVNREQSDGSDKLVENTMFQVLLNAKLTAQILRISTSHQKPILVNGRDGVLATDMGNKELEAVFVEPPSTHQSIPLTEIEFESDSKNLVPTALKQSIWLAATLCSKGRLLPGHRPDQMCRLKAWPNFTRQGFKPEFFKIAAILAKRPATLVEIQQTTQVGMEDIIDFYNAAFAVDLIEKVDGASVAQAEPKKDAAAKTGILRRLAKRLGIG